MDAHLKKYKWLDDIIKNQTSFKSNDIMPSLNMLVSSIQVTTSLASPIQRKNYQSSSSSSGLSDWWWGPAWRPYPYGYGYGGYGYGPTNVIIINNGGGGGHHYGHGGGGGGGGCDAGEAMLLVLLVILVAIVLVGAAALTIAATKEAYANLKEIFGELANNQRVMANLATLTLTALAVGGVVALLASNPVGWGVVGVAIAAVTFYWLCVVALVVTRNINNKIDYSASNSVISGDSRFQLTQGEEAKIRLSLKKQAHAQIDDTIVKIKLSIKELANEVVGAGDRVDSKAVTEQLAKLKKGYLTDAPAFHSGAFKLKFKETSPEQLSAGTNPPSAKGSR
jgi:hypothetical protein